MLLFDLEPDFPAECGLLGQIQCHGDGCLLGRSVCELRSRESGRGRAPSSGLGHGLRRHGEDWRRAGKIRRIRGPSGSPNPPSRPLARDPVRDDGDYGFHEEDVGDDPGHADCHHLIPLVADAGSQNADGSCLDGCGCFIRIDFVQLQVRCNLSSRSDTLPTCLYGGLAKFHGCDDLLEVNLKAHVFHFHQKYAEVSNAIMISCRGYDSFIFHHSYTEIFDLDFRLIYHAARSLEKLSWNQFSVNLWSKVSITVTILQYTYIHTHELSIKGSLIDSHEHISPTCSCCTRSYLMDGTIVEDAVPLLFGLCHRRWTTSPPLLILRFNRGDLLRLSLVKAITYLQLNTHKPQVHTPDRPLGESPTGHQLVWSTKEALEDCNCSKFEPGLSPDKRPLFDSNCSLRYLLCKPRPSNICYVQLSTSCSCSSVSFVILYCDR